MKYYYVRPDFRKKITGGAYPQVQCFINKLYEEKMDVPLTDLYNFTQYENKTPNPQIEFEGFKLHGWAKPTDFLSVVMFMDPIIVVSTKFLDILKDFSIPDFQTHSIEIFWKNQRIMDYRVFYLLNYQSLLQYVDLKKTEFIIYKSQFIIPDDFSNSDIVEKYHCLNTEDLKLPKFYSKIENSQEIYYHSVCTELHLKKCITGYPDILYLGKINYVNMYACRTYFYSERLVEAFIKAGLTGVIFYPVENLYFED